MTEVLLVCRANGAFRSCRASGHALFASRGNDIVCAAETIILRTAMDFLEHSCGILVTKDTASRGKLLFCAEVSETVPLEQRFVALERLKSVADFIRIGIGSLSGEYPKNVRLLEKTED